MGQYHQAKLLLVNVCMIYSLILTGALVREDFSVIIVGLYFFFNRDADRYPKKAYYLHW